MGTVGGKLTVSLTQRMVASGKSPTSGQFLAVSEGLTLGPTLLDVSMNSGTEYALSKVVHGTTQVISVVEEWSVRSLLKLTMTSKKSCIPYRITL